MRRCTVCAHDQREDIDFAIVRGVERTAIAERYGIGRMAVVRHSDAHLSPALVRTAEVIAEADERTLVDRVKDLLGDAYDILGKGKETGDLRLAMSAMENLRRTLKLLGDATGELDHQQPTTVINLQTDPEYVATRTLIMQALTPYPDAKEAVVRALRDEHQPEVIDVRSV